jgi:hypothetical protein
VIRQEKAEIKGHPLAHIQLSSDLLLTAELHDQVLVTGLTLSDGNIEAKLEKEKSQQNF